MKEEHRKPTKAERRSVTSVRPDVRKVPPASLEKARGPGPNDPGGARPDRGKAK